MLRFSSKIPGFISSVLLTIKGEAIKGKAI